MKNVTPALTALFLALGATAFAQPGSLDATFDTNGKVTTDFGSSYDQGYSVAIQLDGKILVAGESNHDFALARYNTDGSLDSSFGGDGKMTTDFGTGYESGRCVAIQSDEKIIVGGSGGQGGVFALARYNTNGTLDPDFNGDGKVTTDIGTEGDFGFSVAIQLDGKILMTGTTFNGIDTDIALVRYNMDGNLDNDFGAGGIVITDFGSGSEVGYSVVIQLDGKIAVIGSASNGTNEDFAIARYNTDGSLDISFGAEGKVSTALGTGSDVGLSGAIQSDGKILVSGYSFNGTNTDLTLVRYNANGSLDFTFGVNGKVTTDFGTGDELGWSIAIQPDGKVVVCGNTNNSNNKDFALARYNTDGSLDNSFGVGGKVITVLGTGDDVGQSVAVHQDGTIIVAGYMQNDADLDFAVARYISGLDIGVVEFSLTNKAPLIHPNPIQEHATLKYTLQNAETISIQLIDMQGKTVQTFIQGQHQAAGAHQQAIGLPEALPSGNYLIAISSPKGRFSVQVVK